MLMANHTGEIRAAGIGSTAARQQLTSSSWSGRRLCARGKRVASALTGTLLCDEDGLHDPREEEAAESSCSRLGITCMYLLACAAK
jgi:hypothetical protein